MTKNTLVYFCKYAVALFRNEIINKPKSMSSLGICWWLSNNWTAAVLDRWGDGSWALCCLTTLSSNCYFNTRGLLLLLFFCHSIHLCLRTLPLTKREAMAWKKNKTLKTKASQDKHAFLIDQTETTSLFVLTQILGFIRLTSFPFPKEKF